VSGRGAIVGGIILIGLGALFLAREIVPDFEVGRLWPIASVALGIALVLLSIRPGRARD
jgi:hypothetical protein